MRKGSPVAYNAETGLAEPAQKAYTGEPNERTTLYRIRRPQENRQLLREGERRNNSRGRKSGMNLTRFRRAFKRGTAPRMASSD